MHLSAFVPCGAVRRPRCRVGGDWLIAHARHEAQFHVTQSWFVADVLQFLLEKLSGC